MEGVNNGIVQIADDVIAIIACTAALEVEGVSGMAGNIAGGIIEKWSKKNSSKGANVQVIEGEVTVGLNIMVIHDYKIQEVAGQVQEKVKTAIETMTGLKTAAVNVNVVSIEFEKNKVVNSAETE